MGMGFQAAPVRAWMQMVRPQRRAFGYFARAAKECPNHLAEVRRTARTRRARTVLDGKRVVARAAEADGAAVVVQPMGSDGSIVAVSESVVKRKYARKLKSPKTVGLPSSRTCTVYWPGNRDEGLGSPQMEKKAPLIGAGGGAVNGGETPMGMPK
jgi:hypothetical protein